MKIAFVFQKDSHFKAVHATALRVCHQYNCEPHYIGVDSEYTPDLELSYTITYIAKNELNLLKNYDYIIACLGGYLLNYVIRALRDTNTKVISIFPGIVSHYQLDAFISRLNADQVWLNSRADYDLYSLICKVLNVKNNGILYGMSWVSLNINQMVLPRQWCEKELAIIFEQTEILSNDEEKKEFAKLILELSNLNQNTLFKYKIRDNTNDSFFKRFRVEISKLSNIEVVTQLTESDIAFSKYYLSISSSALVEGLLRDKKSCIISSELLDADGKEFYKGSNIVLNRLHLDSFKHCNSAWLNYRTLIPKGNFYLQDINKKKEYVNFDGVSFLQSWFLILRLTLHYPHISSLLLEKTRLEAFRKSLLYLSKNIYE